MFFLITISFLACNAGKKAPNSSTNGDKAKGATTKCKVLGTVRDMTGLDGCKFLIEIENGEKWLPTKINDASFTLRDGQNILFGYTEIKDAMSTCMAESKAVEITCIKEVTSGKQKPIVKKCWDLLPEKLTEADWMAKIIADENPFRVLKYDFRDGWAYMIFTGQKRLFYTCQGNNLCQVDKDAMQDCMDKYIKLISNPEVIYQSSKN